LISNKDKEQRFGSALKVMDAFIGPKGYHLSDIGRMATICSILAREFPEWLFIGYYRVIEDELLEIGPYQGAILACGTIAFGRGVCGSAARSGQTMIVDDVSEFPGYIACDNETSSEIVVPVFKDGNLVAVLDIDSSEVGYFNEIDQKYLEQVVKFS